MRWLEFALGILVGVVVACAAIVALLRRRSVRSAQERDRELLVALNKTLFHDVTNATQAIATSSAAFESARDEGDRNRAVSHLKGAIASLVMVVRSARRQQDRGGPDDPPTR
jgi:hypothetical protein